MGLMKRDWMQAMGNKDYDYDYDNAEPFYRQDNTKFYRRKPTRETKQMLLVLE